jgi:hypothetical protein
MSSFASIDNRIAKYFSDLYLSVFQLAYARGDVEGSKDLPLSSRYKDTNTMD